MKNNLVTIAECADFSGLNQEEMLLGVTPSAMHVSLYEVYLLHLDSGFAKVREMMIGDIRRFIDLGASKRAADLLVVLRWFLTDYPQARRCAHPRGPAEVIDFSAIKAAGAARDARAAVAER